MISPDDHSRRRTIAELRAQLGTITERPPGETTEPPGAAQAPAMPTAPAESPVRLAYLESSAHPVGANDPGNGVDMDAGDGGPNNGAEGGKQRPKGSIEDSALSKLAAGPASRHQLATHLIRRGYPKQEVTDLVERYTRVGLLDDAEYAHMLVRSASRNRAKARPALARDLRTAGIDDETARAALDIIDDATEQATARAYVAKKLPGLTRHPPHVIMRRLASQLARRGYSYDTSMAAVTEALYEAGIPATQYPT